VFAANTTDDSGCFPDRLFKQRWERQHLAGTAIENGGQLSTEFTILFLPEVYHRTPSLPRKSGFETICGRSRSEARDIAWSVIASSQVRSLRSISILTMLSARKMA